MAEPDSLNVLQRAIAKRDNNDSSAWQNLTPKQEQVSQAAQRNIERLRNLTQQDSNTWVNKADVDENSLAGSVINLGASVTSAATRTAGDLASVPDNFSLMTHQMNADPRVQEAFQRYQDGSATDEDWAILNSRYGHNISESEKDGYVPSTPEAVQRAENTSTNLEVFQNAQESADRVETVREATDFTDIVDQTARQELSADLRDAEGAMQSLGESWNGIRDGELKDNLLTFVSSLAELTVNGGEAILTNPQAMLEYTAEQVPDLAVGAFSRPALLVRNLGYGLNAYQEGIENYKAENGGALPPEDVQRKMALSSFGMTVLDTVGEFKILDTAGNVRQAVKEGRGILKAGSKAVASNAGVEGVTEGTQTKLEGEATLNPATGMDIYEGTVVGTGVGGAISAPMAGAEVVQGTRENREEQQAEEAAVARTEDGQIGEYIRQGDFDGLAQSEDVPADRAAMAIYETITQDEATPEQKESGRKALAKMQVSLDRRIEALEEEGGVVPKKRKEETKQRIRQIDALIADAKDKGNTEVLQELQAMQKRQKDVLRTDRTVDPARRKEIEGQLEQLRRARELSVQNREQTVRDTDTAEQQRTQFTEATNSEAAPEVRKAAADQTVTRLMSGTSNLTESDISSLLEKAGDVLDTDQQSYLRSLTTAQQARNAASDLESVGQDIFSGSKDGSFKGLPEYRRNVMAALDAGDMAAARQELEALEQFEQSHVAKADLAQQANQQAAQTRRPMNIWRDYSSESGWRLEPGRGKKDDTRLRDNGGLQIGYGRNYENVARNIRTEADAIAATRDELAQAVNLADRQADRAATEETVAQTEETANAEPQSNTVYPHIKFEPVKGGMDSDTFRQTNLIGAYFGFRKTRETDSSQHPLTNQQDFLSTVLAPAVAGGQYNVEALRPYISNLGDLDGATESSPQMQVLAQFAGYAREWGNALDTIFTQKPDEYRYTDPVQFFADADGRLPENVKTAIAGASFTWLQDNLADKATNDESDIRAILDLGDNDPLPEDWQDLRLVGTRESNVQQDLGRKAFQALGLRLNADAPVNHQTQLETSLGAYAMNLLVQAEFIERLEVRSNALPERTDGSVDLFVRPVREAWTRTFPLPEHSQQIVDVSRNTQGVVGKLFSVDQIRQEPSFEPVPFTQKTTKGTSEEIPRDQQDIIEGEQAKPWVIRDDMRQITTALEAMAPDRARKLLYRMAGAVDLVTYKVQKANQHSLEGKNQGLQREVDTALGFFENPAFAEDPTKPFFIPLSVWSNQRVGMNSLINPLESKVHRFMVGKKEWEHQVPLKGNGKGVTKQDKHNLRQFRLAVLEGLGEKVDKNSNATILKNYDKVVAGVQPHVDAVRALLTGEEVTTQQLQAMADYVAGKEQMHTFDTLVHLARRQVAEMNGQDSFTSTLIREGDGITNGPALATILSGAWQSMSDGLRLVNKMGFFEKGNPIQSAGKWQEVASNNDLYQTLAHRVAELVKHIAPRENDTRRQQYHSVFALTGWFLNDDGSVSGAGRNSVKTPLTAMAFGSSVPKAVRSMGEDLVDKFYADIEKVLNDGNKTDAQKVRSVNHLAYHMNKLIGAPRLQIRELTLEQAQQLELSSAQRKAAVNTFTDTVGKQIQKTLDEQFNSPLNEKGRPDPNKHSFIQHRQLLNDVASKTFQLYMAARDYEIRQFKEELMEAGELAWTKTKAGKTPLQSLTRKQLQTLDKRLKGLNPLVHTAMSKASNHREAGLHMGKPKMQPKIGDRAYLSDVTFGKPLKTVTGPDSSRTAQSLKRHGQAMGYDDPGVRVFITNVHAFDSAIASDTYKDFPALNVHDAEIVAAYMMQEVAQQMNGATFKHLVDFSLSEEVLKTGYRVYDNFKARIPELEGSPEYQALGSDFLAEIEDSLLKALRGANIAETNKLNLLAQIETVNQYGVEGGEYKLNEDDYNKIAERQKTTVTARIAEDRARNTSETTASLMAKMNAWEDTADPRQFVPVEQGTPAVAGDPRLISMLERTPVMPARTLLRRLGENPLNKALARLVNPKLKVRYVTANTPRDQMPQHELNDTRGYYTVRDGKEEIGILSPDFAESLVTEEVVTHEVLHSVLDATITNVQNGTDTRSDAKAFVDELEQLRANVVQWLNQPENASLKDKYLSNSNALDDVHELVSWGMTNQAFQTEVLSKVEMKSQNTGRLTNALKAFVTNIARFLFGKTGAVRDNGLGVLLVNTAGLMDQAKQKRQAARDVTRKQRTGPQPEDVRRWSSQEIFAALDDGELSPADRERMGSVLDQVVIKVQGAQGPWTAQTDAQSPADRFAVAKATGEMPFSSQAIGQFPLTRQQMFVLEQAEVALRESMAADSLAYKELVRVFRDARDRLTPKDFLDGDWSTATMDQKTAAQEKYDFLFKLNTVPGESRSNHLSRFAAMALVSPELYNKLNDPVSPEVREGAGLGDRIKGLYDTSMEKLGDRVNQTYSQQGTNRRVEALAYRLADIQAKHKNTLAQDNVSVTDQVDAAAARLGEAAKSRLGAVADSDLFAGSNNGFMKALGETGSAISEDRVTEVLDALEDYRAYVFKSRQGLFSSLISEMRGSTDKNLPFHKLLRQGGKNERERKMIQRNVTDDIRSRFSRELDKEHSDALTRTVLRTDMSALQTYFTDEELNRLLESPQALKDAIRQWEDRVENQGQLGDHYVAYSKLLGYFMATGKARGPNMSLNAYNIARGAGTRFTVSEQQARQAEGAIDALTSLYALNYTNTVDRERAASIFREENRRGSESGVRYLVKLHEQLKAEALETLFDGDKSLFIKGYTREIYNPYTDIVAENAADGRDLVAQGWQQLPKHLVHDNADPDQEEKFLYVRKWGGLQQHVTGSVSYTGTRRKGSAVHGGHYIPSQQDVHQENTRTTRDIESAHLNQMRRVSRQGRKLNPENISSNFMVPVRNTQGESVNFRYFMTEENKDVILERNNQVEDILGSMASHMFDKVTTEQQNRQVMESLKEFYDQEYRRRPEAFITVGPESDDAQARETYHLLPPKTKEVIHQVWGQEGVKVRADMIDMVFGYRKFSLENLVDKPQVKNRVVQAILDTVVDAVTSRYLLGESARKRIRQSEDIWQSLVQITKDNWVIKNLSTLMGNISSNVSILLWSGMSPRKVVETHRTAINGLLDYNRDHEELVRLEREQSLGLSSNPQQLNQRILELRDAIDRNPVKGLLDEGLFQTIVEDVDSEADDYSYKSQILSRVNEATEGVPSQLKAVGKQLLMTHDTTLYKVLFKSTAMSDFVARYALYEHLTTRKRDPMEHDQAVQRIADTFVNYDVPTHRTLQYLNDMGAVYFTKYYLRIQKVLLNLMQENPVRGIGLALMENYFSGLATVLDSSPRLSNPLDAGALNLPGSMTEILPIKLLTSLW